VLEKIVVYLWLDTMYIPPSLQDRNLQV